MTILRIILAVLLTLVSSVQAADLHPIPNAQQQQEVEQLAKEVYGFSKASRLAEKLALARTLIEEAKATDDDATAQYVLFNLALQLSKETNSPEGVVNSINELDERFDIDAISLKFESLGEIDGRRLSAAKRLFLAESLVAVMNDAVEAERFADAVKLSDEAVRLAKQSRDFRLARAVVQRAKEIRELANAWNDIKAAVAELEKNPTHPKANLLVGKYRCFVKRDWVGGLPLLALSDDAALEQLANLELEEPNDATKQVELANEWWELAENLASGEARAVKSRAAHWYAMALPNIDGFNHALAEKRIHEVGDEAASVAPREVDLLRIADPRKHTLMGIWRRTPQGLFAPGGLNPATGNGFHSILHIPHNPGEEYVIEAVVSRLKGAHMIGFWLPSGSARFRVVFDAKDRGDPYMLIGDVDGKAPKEMGTRIPYNSFPTNQPVKMTITVKRDEIQVQSGQRNIGWKGDFNRLTNLKLNHWTRTPNPNHIYIDAFESAYVVSSLKVKPIARD